MMLSSWRTEIIEHGTVLTDPAPIEPPHNAERFCWFWTETELYQLADDGYRVYVRYVDGPRIPEPREGDTADDWNSREWNDVLSYKHFNIPQDASAVLDFLFGQKPKGLPTSAALDDVLREPKLEPIKALTVTVDTGTTWSVSVSDLTLPADPSRRFWLVTAAAALLREIERMDRVEVAPPAPPVEPTEVEKLRAELAEAHAELAANDGQAAGALPGWRFDGESWAREVDGYYLWVGNAQFGKGWDWTIIVPCPCPLCSSHESNKGHETAKLKVATARGAMRSAEAKLAELQSTAKPPIYVECRMQYQSGDGRRWVYCRRRKHHHGAHSTERGCT